MELFDPLDLIQREALLSSHPLRTKTFTTLTKTIESAYGRIREQIWLGRPSLYFYSTPRMGKSQCAAAIRHLISQEFTDKYVVLVSCDVSEIESVVETICKAINLIPKSREKLSKLRGRLSTHICCELASISGNHFVMILDEMQALTLTDYKHLQVIQNDLKIKGISTTTVGFAQSEINSRQGTFRLAEEDAIIARFLSQRISFRGCTDQTWLKALLANFDDQLFYPLGSGCSYSRFFLPQAVANGFRLDDYADIIYKSVTETVGGSAGLIPIEHLFTAIEYMLISARGEDTPDFRLSQTIIQSAIVESNMAEFSRIFK